MMIYVFWLSILLPLYAILGYPLLLLLLSPFYRPGPRQGEKTGSLSVIVAAHNEESNIVAKLESILQQAGNRQDLEIIVASDGSTDRTVSLARGCNDDRIRVLDLPRLGKTTALNEAVSHAGNELLVFTDADNIWLEGALENLLEPFGDSGVGCSAGNMIIGTMDQALGFGDRLYREYESWIRSAENRIGCMVSADGALLALRRELYQEIPAHVNDDFYISTCAAVHGKKIIYVKNARVLDEGVEQSDKQYRRRLRVTVGGLNSLVARKELFNPLRHGMYSIALISHKLLRRLAPVFLLPLLVSNLFLLALHPLYQVFLFLQLCGYFAAIPGIVTGSKRLPKLLRIASFVLVTAAGMSAGLAEFLMGKKYSYWNPQQNR